MKGFDITWLMSHYAKEKAKRPAPNPQFIEAKKETGHEGLQQQIKDWCDAQWPHWVYDFPRTDLKSTLPEGRHDATVWGPYPLVFCIETKAKGKKQRPEQLIWQTRMRALGWTVFVIYSLDEFLSLVQAGTRKLTE
jgi:hypothetical protein